jgi:hypothetical protein
MDLLAHQRIARLGALKPDPSALPVRPMGDAFHTQQVDNGHPGSG